MTKQFSSSNLQNLIILAIDTSCDETSAAVTQGTSVLSNVIWSQASAHAKFGGVMPSLAARMHQERIGWVVEAALRQAQCGLADVSAIAVTIGPGLAIALGVGIAKAKELSSQLNVPLFAVNHIEGHLLSAMANPKSQIPISKQFQFSNFKFQIKPSFPALGLVVSGGHTELIYMEKIGKYKILAETQDDALGEALDKAARMLGLGYPGGAVLEKMARSASSGQALQKYPLPLPMARQKERHEFSYSGLKTAFYRLVEKQGELDKKKICDLAASFQNRAFQHFENVVKNTILTGRIGVKDILVGGGVVANVELRKRLRKMGKELGLKVWFPYSKKLIGDNAAMVGVTAYLRYKDAETQRFKDYSSVDRRARWSVEEI